MLLGLLGGRHIKKSLSPQIYQIISSEYSEQMEYKLYFNESEINPEIEGINITNPFKADYFNKNKSLFLFDNSVEKTQYANTYHFGKKQCWNTDIYGIKKAVEENKLNPKSVAIIGAGDVSESIKFLYPNSSRFNRSPRKNSLNLEDFRKQDFDLVFNTTPLDINGEFVFNLSYHVTKKINTLDGLSMLIWQAIKNFELWFDREIEDKNRLKKFIYEKLKK